MPKLKRNKKNKKVNRWLCDPDRIDADIIALSEEATTIHDGSVCLLKGIKAYIKALHIPLGKHPLARAAREMRSYKENMSYPSDVFDSGAIELEKMFGAIETHGTTLNSSVLAKLISFNDIECKEIDSHMKNLRKLQKDWKSKEKKADKNDNTKVLAEAAAESFKKVMDESRDMLKKFNSTGTALMNGVAADMVKSFDQYCKTGSCGSVSKQQSKGAAKAPTAAVGKKEEVEEEEEGEDENGEEGEDEAEDDK